MEFGCAEACAGHSNNDFESMGLPSYQHFRPSIRRQDQYPCGFDGIAALHFCFACAVGIPIDESVAMQAAKAHAVKLHARLNQNAAVPTVASPSNLVAVGRKLDRIHNYEANFLEEDNQAIAVAPIGEGDQCTE